MANIVSIGQKWARLEKEYQHNDCTYDTKIWVAGEKRCDLSARKRIIIWLN